MRVPALDPQREKLISHFESKLAYFQRLPQHRRGEEAADEGEATCRAMIAELRNIRRCAPDKVQPARFDSMTQAEFLAELENGYDNDKR